SAPGVAADDYLELPAVGADGTGVRIQPFPNNPFVPGFLQQLPAGSFQPPAAPPDTSAGSPRPGASSRPSGPRGSPPPAAARGPRALSPPTAAGGPGCPPPGGAGGGPRAGVGRAGPAGRRRRPPRPLACPPPRPAEPGASAARRQPRGVSRPPPQRLHAQRAR